MIIIIIIIIITIVLSDNFSVYIAADSVKATVPGPKKMCVLLS